VKKTTAPEVQAKIKAVPLFLSRIGPDRILEPIQALLRASNTRDTLCATGAGILDHRLENPQSSARGGGTRNLPENQLTSRHLVREAIPPQEF